MRPDERLGIKAGIPTPPPESMPFMTLSSHRCDGRNVYKDGCACRPLGGDPDEQREKKLVAPGAKRYEIRLFRTRNPSVVAVGALGRASRDDESPAEVCYYVDYGPGSHLLTYSVKARDGDHVSTGIALYEYNPSGHFWYPVFEQRCGDSQFTCGPSALEEWRTAFVRGQQGRLDPCSSTRVMGVRWGGRRSTGSSDSYSDLTLEFSTKTYRFSPKFPPGSPLCKRKRRPDSPED